MRNDSNSEDSTRGSSQSDEITDEVTQSIAGGGEAVFSRNKGGAPTKLQDFIIRKMIGKGTFGKVFLVEHNSTGKLFAMKCIRKDKILEHD